MSLRLLGPILFSLFFIDPFTSVFGFVSLCTWLLRRFFVSFQ